MPSESSVGWAMQHRGPQWTIKLPSCDYVLPRPKGPQEPPWLNYLLFCRARLDSSGKPPHRHRKHRLAAGPPPELPPAPPPLQDTVSPLSQQPPQYFTPVTAAGSYWPSPHEDHPYLICRPPLEALYQQGDACSGSRTSLLCPWREVVQHRPKGPWNRRELLEDAPREPLESLIVEPLPCAVDVGDGDGTPRPAPGDARDVLVDEQEEIVAFLGEVDERHERQLAFERVLLEASGCRRRGSRRDGSREDSLDVVVRAAALQRSVSDHVLYDRRASEGKRSDDWPLHAVRRDKTVEAQASTEPELETRKAKTSASDISEQKVLINKVSIRQQVPRENVRPSNPTPDAASRNTKESMKRNNTRGGNARGGGGDNKKMACHESHANKNGTFPRKEYHNKRYGDAAQQDSKNDSGQGKCTPVQQDGPADNKGTHTDLAGAPKSKSPPALPCRTVVAKFNPQTLTPAENASSDAFKSSQPRNQRTYQREAQQTSRPQAPGQRTKKTPRHARKKPFAAQWVRRPCIREPWQTKVADFGPTEVRVHMVNLR
ncbi:uncharacterized protein LOC135393764 isoform X2 [Ornithodoros turicata]|uniref:uncharacterized protein LOC135393764 isoform X2 n=1 Tax=Ornithodoros turicata TaxID=34597 RepID=UPI0031390055